MIYYAVIDTNVLVIIQKRIFYVQSLRQPTGTTRIPSSVVNAMGSVAQMTMRAEGLR